MPASKVAAAAEPAREAVAALPMSSSQPLDAKTAEIFGDRFGFDFGDVRIHADSSATGAADRLGARAFTLANHVFFSRGAYEPTSSRGMELLAHELTHVAQQSSGGTASPQAQERQADAA